MKITDLSLLSKWDNLHNQQPPYCSWHRAKCLDLDQSVSQWIHSLVNKHTKTSGQCQDREMSHTLLVGTTRQPRVIIRWGWSSPCWRVCTEKKNWVSQGYSFCNSAWFYSSHVHWHNSSIRGARHWRVHRSLQKHRPSAENAILIKEIQERRAKWEDTKSTSEWRSLDGKSLCLEVRTTLEEEEAQREPGTGVLQELWETQQNDSERGIRKNRQQMVGGKQSFTA